jgi:hypothetical protein
VPELRRDIEELAKNPPQKKTPVQAAAEMLEEIDACLAKSESKDQASQPRKKARRRARKPARCRPAKRATKRRVQRAEPAQPDDRALPAPAPAPQSDPAPLAPDSAPSATVPPAGAEVVASSLRLESGLSISSPRVGTEEVIKADQG